VIIFGRLPIEMWLLFYCFVAIMAVFFAKALKQKISDAKNAE
jgi:hypothetical protein